MFSNQPEDVVTNTMYFTELIPIGKPAVAAAITPLLGAFYGSIYSSSRMANYMQPALATVRWYDMSDPEPRVPLIVPLGIVGPTTAASQLPTETSVVLSFQGDRVSGQPQARRRGRIYLGGWATIAIASSSAGSYPEVGGLITAAIKTAANTLRTASASAGAPWSVWSTTDQQSVLITNGWVDSSPDTQRRRGINPTVRVLFP